MTASFAERQIGMLDPAGHRRVVPPEARAGASLGELLRAALRAPIDSVPLAELGRAAARIAVVVSDATRDEPREALIEAVLELVPESRVLLVVAAGTHAADDSAIPPRFAHLPRVVHDASRLERCVDLGRTTDGTRVRLLRELVEADMVVLLGRVRPHYFAGFSGGVKALFPGCAYAEDVLENHRLKADPSARLGQTATNRCRLDMEAAAALAGPKLHLLNVLCDCEGTPVAAAAGHPVSAHRALAAEAQAVFAVQAPRSSIVIVADRPPVTRSLYQASKLLPAAAPLLEPGGTAILVAECDLGIGPIERVNEGIYRLGIAPLLPARHRVVLVSELSPAVVRESYAEPASDLASALAEAQASHPAARAVVVWRAGECITRATD